MFTAVLETMEEVQPPVTPPIDSNGDRSEATLLDLCEVFTLSLFSGDLIAYINTMNLIARINFIIAESFIP